MLAPTIHPAGIYFGLPEDVYHADPALGSTSLKALAIDAYEFQFDRLYGDDEMTDALLFGQALHKRMLEGRAAFEGKFCKAFDRKSVPPEALDTVADLRDWLASRDQRAFKSALKGALIARVLEIDPRALIVENIKEKWEAENEGRVALAPRRWEQVEIAARFVQRDPLLSQVMEDGTFIEGAPEVSIFYEQNGVRLKARFDRLLRHAIVDLKSFAAMFAGRVETAARKAILRMRYDLQAASYLKAWQQAKMLYADGLVYGDEPITNFLDEAFDRDEPTWIWVMVKSTGAPQPLVIEWAARNAKAAAAHQVEAAIVRYAELRDRYGEDKEWPPERPAWTLTDADIPAYFTDEG